MSTTTMMTPEQKFQQLFETEVTSDKSNAKINDLRENRKDTAQNTEFQYGII